MTDTIGSLAWALRMGLQWGGVWLAAAGYGDEALWQALGGSLLTIGGAVWSWRARKAQKAEVPV